MSATARDHYLSEFGRIQADLPGRRLPWLARMRERALAQFAETGFPTTRQEDWKYTNVAPFETRLFSAADRSREIFATAPFEALTLADCHLLVFINGYYAPALSRLGPLPAGATISSLSEMLEHQPGGLEDLLTQGGQSYPTGFAALNAAFMGDGVYIHLAPGVSLDCPVHLVFVGTAPGLAVHLRNLVVAEQDSRAVIVEHYDAPGDAPGGAGYFTNAVTDIIAQRGAEIEHHKLQQESSKAFHIATVNVAQSLASRVASGSFAFGGGLSRTDINVRLNAERAECRLDGLYLAAGRQHVDHHTRIDHFMPRGVSREYYKGVLDGAARAVFNGKVIVHPHAQGSDAQQVNKNLLLSDDAEVDTKPELEIYADDVKCSHGATVGQLDADQLFYLRSRGVDSASARELLIYAFAEDVIARIKVAPLRARLENLLRGRMPQATKELS